MENAEQKPEFQFKVNPDLRVLSEVTTGWQLKFVDPAGPSRLSTIVVFEGGETPLFTLSCYFLGLKGVEGIFDENGHKKVNTRWVVNAFKRGRIVQLSHREKGPVEAAF